MSSRQSRTKLHRLAIIFFESENSIAKVETKRIVEKSYAVGDVVTVNGCGWIEKGIIKYLNGKLLCRNNSNNNCLLEFPFPHEKKIFFSRLLFRSKC